MIQFTRLELEIIRRALRNEATGIGSYPVACLELEEKIREQLDSNKTDPVDYRTEGPLDDWIFRK